MRDPHHGLVRPCQTWSLPLQTSSLSHTFLTLVQAGHLVVPSGHTHSQASTQAFGTLTPSWTGGPQSPLFQKGLGKSWSGTPGGAA